MGVTRLPPPLRKIFVQSKKRHKLYYYRCGRFEVSKPNHVSQQRIVSAKSIKVQQSKDVITPKINSSLLLSSSDSWLRGGAREEVEYLSSQQGWLTVKSVSDQYFAFLNLSFGFFSFWDKFRFVKYFLGFLSLTHRQVRYLLRWLTYFVTCVCQKHTWISHFWKRTCMIDRLQ